MTGERRLPEERGVGARAGIRLARHAGWVRAEGPARLVEEDGLDPVDRARRARARWQWRRDHPREPGSARLVLVVGVQRSGTNLVLRALASLPEVEPYAENDPRLFTRFRLRSPDLLLARVGASRHDVVVVKPLCDSHLTAHLLDAAAPAPGTTPAPAAAPATGTTPAPGTTPAHNAPPGHNAPSTPTTGAAPAPRALWVWREPDARARSAVAKFGPVNRDVLARLARNGLDESWQAGGMTPEILATLRDLDPARLTPLDGAALFWWVRNTLVHTTGLDARPDVTLARHEDLVADPAGEWDRICAASGLSPHPDAVPSVRLPPVRRPARLDLDPRVRALCDDLSERLREATRAPTA